MIAAEVLVPIEEKGALAAMMREYIGVMAEFVPGVSANDPYQTSTASGAIRRRTARSG